MTSRKKSCMLIVARLDLERNLAVDFSMGESIEKIAGSSSAENCLECSKQYRR